MINKCILHFAIFGSEKKKDKGKWAKRILCVKIKRLSRHGGK